MKREMKSLKIWLNQNKMELQGSGNYLKFDKGNESAVKKSNNQKRSRTVAQWNRY